MARPTPLKHPRIQDRPAGRNGYTLVELLVALTIVGILSAIVYPSYTQYIARANRAELRTILMENAQFLERNYSEASRYDQDGGGNAVALPYRQSPKAAAKKYSIAVQFPDAGECAGGQCYTLLAVPTGAMQGDACGTYQLNHTGAQNNIGNQIDSTACWQR